MLTKCKTGLKICMLIFLPFHLAIADAAASVWSLPAQLEASFEEVEEHLLHLEDLCGQCELERHKHRQAQQLENYRKSKR